MTPTATDTSTPPRLFDRKLLQARRNRCAGNIHDHHFLAQRCFDDICDRVESISRDFQRTLILGGGPALTEMIAGRHLASKLDWVAQSDLSPAIARRLAASPLCLDEERLPIADESVDLILAPLNLHWTNDLPGALVQINRALKPDGF